MLSVLANRTYAHLFSAQVIALLGTGLLTVALGLLAYDLAGDRAGAVLGTALTIKMVAYVGLAPVAHAAVARLPRKAVLIGADLLRAGVALFLPFVDSIWQVYGLIFLLQAASATFSPAFQATIPDVLPDEEDYTKALSLARLAMDLENLISPTLAGLLLLVTSFHGLFAGTVLGFLGSTWLVWRCQLPRPDPAPAQPFLQRVTHGSRLYLATPRLRGLLALNLAAAAVGAFVIVNTVVVVRVAYGGSETDLALAMAAFGAGSMMAAFTMPKLLQSTSDRQVMIGAALLLSGVTLGVALDGLMRGWLPWSGLLAVWMVCGALYSAILTPSGRLLRRSAPAAERPALFAAQFALSHACWLLTYPLAGWAGALFGLHGTLFLLGVVALTGTTVALRVWPRSEI